MKFNMKFIDDKGRLFGKINVIDFLILLFFFVSLPLFLRGYRMLSVKPKAPQEKKIIDIYLNALLILPPDVSAKLIAAGDKAISDQGAVTGELLEANAPVPYTRALNIGAQEKIFIADPVLKQMPVKLKIEAEIKGEDIFYNGQRIIIKEPFIFKTGKYSVKAMPILQREEKWVTVKVKFSSLSDELSRFINEGHLEKDAEGKISGVLKRILSVSSSRVSAVTRNKNEQIFISDPYRNDVVAFLDILCSEKDGNLYFKNSPVKIGSQIVFSSSIYVIAGAIIDIEK